jgi:predicted transcriptional regulator
MIVSATIDEPLAEALGRHRPLLMSVRPRFAEAILDGTKTVELRRTRVAAAEGTRIVLYATAPTMAIVGLVTLEDRDTNHPSIIWRRYRRHLALARHEFDLYLVGAPLATALTLSSPQRLQQPQELAHLRHEAAFKPPQSYRYIAPSDPYFLRELGQALPR